MNIAADSIGIKKVAVVRALKLGDLLVAVPALRALRLALPHAEIALVSLPWAREFVERFAHRIDRFLEFPGWPGLPEVEPQLNRIPDFLARMQAEQFDLVLQMHGSGSIVNEMCSLFGGRVTAGFYRSGEYCPHPRTFLPWPERGLELHRLLALTQFLGFPHCGDDLEYPLGPSDFARAEAICAAEHWTYACIHPGASVAERRWPEARFAAIADALASRGLRIVLTGTSAETHLTGTVAKFMAAPAMDLAGKTDLGTAAALLARARLIVCNDTGVSHLAAAVRTPSVVISTGDNPERWAPVDSAIHCVLCQPRGLVPVRAGVAAALELVDRVTPVLRLNAEEHLLCGPSAS